MFSRLVAIVLQHRKGHAALLKKVIDAKTLFFGFLEKLTAYSLSQKPEKVSENVQKTSFAAKNQF